jgi:hypothetical protein
VSTSAWVKRLLYRNFVLLQQAKLDVLPRHFYSEIPDIGRLRKTKSWRREYPLHGIEGRDCGEQLAFARSVAGDIDLPGVGANIYEMACRDNGVVGFGPIEAQFLYAFVLSKRPANIIQVGAGASTAVILQAAQTAGWKPNIVCIDPYPTEYLKRCAAEGKITLRESPVEELSPETAVMLQPMDLFFVDSSHTLGPAGEVTRLILEWLPLLAKGVHAHFHDILFPFDYDTKILKETLFFYHESSLLMAFLSMNPSFRINCSLAMLHHKRQSELRELFNGYIPAQFQDGVETVPGMFPSSIYLERVA